MGNTVRVAGTNATISIRARTRHWEITKARMEKTSPSLWDPIAVVDDAAAPGTGKELTGTLISTLDTATGIVDVTPGMVYRHNVRNVATYSAGSEATWAAILEGAPVYFNRSSNMPAGCLLSLAPLDSAGVANPFFGYVVRDQDEVAGSFPKGDTSAGTFGCAVMQVGVSAT